MGWALESCIIDIDEERESPDNRLTNHANAMHKLYQTWQRSQLHHMVLLMHRREADGEVNLLN